MGKKAEKKAAKPNKAAGKTVDAGRWTVRGISPKLQKAVTRAAQHQELTVGVWLSAVIERALAAAPERAAATGDSAVAQGQDTLAWRAQVESRLRALEQHLPAPASAPISATNAEGDAPPITAEV